MFNRKYAYSVLMEVFQDKNFGKFHTCVSYSIIANSDEWSLSTIYPIKYVALQDHMALQNNSYLGFKMLKCSDYYTVAHKNNVVGRIARPQLTSLMHVILIIITDVKISPSLTTLPMCNNILMTLKSIQ